MTGNLSMAHRADAASATQVSPDTVAIYESAASKSATGPEFQEKVAGDAPAVLIVPGLHGSEDAHWQSWLERSVPRAYRVAQRDWSKPSLTEWSARLREAISLCASPVVLVGHSFGCLTIAQALLSAASEGAHSPSNVSGALLVAPANPARFGIDPMALRVPLNVESVLVASENDPWMSFGDAHAYAKAWGSDLVNLGLAGHINVAAGYGEWELGAQLTRMLCRRASSKARAARGKFPATGAGGTSTSRIPDDAAARAPIQSGATALQAASRMRRTASVDLD